MTPADIRQEMLQQHFQPGIGRIVFAPDTRNPKPSCLLLTYKGVLASDKQEVSDNAVRASSNRAYAKHRGSVEERAKAWMAAHPAVYAMFEKFALEVAAKRTRFSAKAIIERMRWETAVEGGSDFKIANAVTAYLARRFVSEHPEYASLFLRAKRGGAA